MGANRNKLQGTTQSDEHTIVPDAQGQNIRPVAIQLPTDPEDSWALLGLRLNGQCQAIARFGTITDGGWNTCLQPGLLAERKTSTGQPAPTKCSPSELACPWTALQRERWPPKDCVVYSFGSNWNFVFEQSINALGCTIHTFDPSMPQFVEKGLDKVISKHTNINFYPIGLGVKDEEKDKRGWRVMTLQSIMSMLGTKRLEILKIDIENDEWPFFDWLFESKLLETDTVRQIMLEIHISTIGDTNPETPFLTEEEIQRIAKYMGRFEEYGFKLWARDENRYCRRLKAGGVWFNGCLEVSYVRTEIKSPVSG